MRGCRRSLWTHCPACRVLHGQEVGSRAGIHVLPRGPAVVAPVYAPGGEGAVDAVRIPGIVLDGVQGQSAARRLPRGVGGVFVQPSHGAPAAARVVAHEEAGGLDAGVEAAGMGGWPGRQEPDGLQAPLVSVMGGRLEDVPARTAVLTAVHVGAVDAVVRGRPGRAAVTRVEDGVIDLSADEPRRGDGPVLPVRGVGGEETALRADEEEDLRHGREGRSLRQGGRDRTESRTLPRRASRVPPPGRPGASPTAGMRCATRSARPGRLPPAATRTRRRSRPSRGGPATPPRSRSASAPHARRGSRASSTHWVHAVGCPGTRGAPWVMPRRGGREGRHPGQRPGAFSRAYRGALHRRAGRPSDCASVPSAAGHEVPQGAAGQVPHETADDQGAGEHHRIPRDHPRQRACGHTGTGQP